MELLGLVESKLSAAFVMKPVLTKKESQRKCKLG